MLIRGPLDVRQGRPGARPLWGRGEFSFRPLSGHASFPSGHAAYTFAMAGAIDEATDGRVPAVLGYTVASATALSRVYDDKHWLSDIVVGGTIGPDASAPGDRTGLRAHLIAAPGFLGVGLTFQEPGPRRGAVRSIRRRIGRPGRRRRPASVSASRSR